MQLFASDAVMTSDGGGKVTAVHRPLLGAERISYLYFVIARRRRTLPLEDRIVSVNGELGLAWYWKGQVFSVTTIETDGDVIYTVYAIRNPDKLRAFTVS